MYCHPHAVKKWAKAMKPEATAQQIEQAKKMRLAKQKKSAFLAAQFPLFSPEKKTAPGGSRNATLQPRQHP